MCGSQKNAEWVKVPIMETLQQVICRVTNRVFVGAPLCPRYFPGFWFVQYERMLFLGRDRDYQDLNLTFAVNVVKHGTIISFFPKLLKPCVVISIYIPLFLPLTHKLALWHACCRTVRLTSDKRWSLSDLWSRSGPRRWRNLETTGINQYVDLIVS